MTVAQVSSAQRSMTSKKRLSLILATLGMVTMSFGRTRIGEWTLSDLLFALAGLALLAERMEPIRQPRGARPSALSPAALGSILLLTTATLSSFAAIDPMESIGVVLRLAWLSLLWLWILQGVAPSLDAFETLIRGLRWTVLISSAVAIGGYLGVINLSERINETRETGLYTHPNHLAAMLVVGLPFIMLDAPTPRAGRRSIAVRLGLSGFVMLAIMTTGSMTAVIGVVVILLTFAVVMTLVRSSTRRRAHPFVRLLGLFAGVLVIGYALQSSTPVVERFQSLGDSDSDVAESARSRGEHADAVLSNLDQLLVLGVGLDNASASINLSEQGSAATIDEEATANDPSSIHNIYLRLIHDGGLPTLVGFLIIVVTCLRNSWLLVVHSRGKEIYATAVALTASLVAINVVAQFRTPIYQRYFWVPMVLTSTLWVAYRNDLRDAKRDAEPPAAGSRKEEPLVPDATTTV